ncbi:hypothetical protein QBC38DRAFT_515700 [Podospora fimiseda]|uniref:FAD-binding PCMH-type domain-containing protein n=1 Tax=Podospora fimiseda TaxID=252190 RepID=A0AAN7GQD8_9PEZI|nr:hypothetical protein QBC38DRAFT_515700 [Podospora fimiseda]
MTSQTPESLLPLLSHGLPPSTIHLPTSQTYLGSLQSYWSLSASSLTPLAILQPTTPHQLSLIISHLSTTKTPFAIRSGGHTNWASSNNISSPGITIDLSCLSTNTISLSEDKSLVSLGPALKWKQVYAFLHDHGLAVPGGREGNVGVAGLLLGGGNTFFTAKHGFACDNVVSYEIILASGEITVASSEQNPDLFRALKGGSNNFGIVTQFTMRTVPCSSVWGGMAFYHKSQIPTAIENLVSFTEDLEKGDRDNNLIVIFGHQPDFKDVVIATLYVNVAGKEKPIEFKKWLEMPEIMSMVKMTSLKEMSLEYNIPDGLYDIWFTLSFKNDARILTKASELHDELVEKLKTFIPEQDFITQCLFQPLPKRFGQNSVAAGGNVMGVERHDTNGILFLATVMAKTGEQEVCAYPLVKQWMEEVKEFAKSIDGMLPWVYLNYADKSQDPLSSYGKENLEKIRETAKKYDPEGVFQTLCPGGFKISKVDG